MNGMQTWAMRIKGDDVFIVDMHPLDDRESEPAMVIGVRMGTQWIVDGVPEQRTQASLRVLYADGAEDQYDVRDENLRFVSGEDLVKHNLTHW